MAKSLTGEAKVPSLEEFNRLRDRLTLLEKENLSLAQRLVVAEHPDDRKRLEAPAVQSEKMEAMARLAGRVAHDFNNLLTVINGYSAMLSERLDLSEDVCSDLASIRRAGERAKSLTGKLLAFSRRLPGRPQALVLGEALAQADSLLRLVVRPDIELTTNVRTSELCVRMDPAQFEQIILELVTNAQDAIQERGIITIETATASFDAENSRLLGNIEPGEYAAITVSDTGRGIPEEDRERIFEPFFTTKEAGPGTGFGLATIYSIVNQSGGAISVQSGEQGTSIRLYLPVVEKTELPGPSVTKTID